MKLICFLSLILCFGSVKAQKGFKSNTDDNTLLWEISGKGLAKPSYLFGTFHLLCNDDIHFSATLEKALANADEVYMELDMDDPSTVKSSLKLFNMKDGKKLKDLYTAEEYKRVVDFFKDSLQFYITLFQRLKPQFLEPILYAKFLKCKTTSMEDAVMKIAKQQNKEIKGLETMELQASLFDNIPYDEQAKQLLEAIDSLEMAKNRFSLLMTAYIDQRMDNIEKYISDPAYGVEENHDILLDARNKNWVIQLKQIMKKKVLFTAVGAGHLMGKNGLINLLRAEGFTVRALENKFVIGK